MCEIFSSTDLSNHESTFGGTSGGKTRISTFDFIPPLLSQFHHENSVLIFTISTAVKEEYKGSISVISPLTGLQGGKIPEVGVTVKS